MPSLQHRGAGSGRWSCAGARRRQRAQPDGGCWCPTRPKHLHISVLVHLWAMLSTWEAQAEAEQSGGPRAGSSLPAPASPQTPAPCSPRLGSAPGTWHCSHPPSARVSPGHFCTFCPTSLQGTPLLCSQHWLSLSLPSSPPSPKYSSHGMGK